MNTTDHSESILKEIDLKFQAINQKTEVQLEGLLWSKPITYWDYIQTDALLNLQIQRTTLPDEMVFIMYHQVNELIFKMILWEIDQIADTQNIQVDFFSERLSRITRYFDMLTNSFSIMENGMDVDQYMKFRNTLTPASGFQSAQYRLIEFASTDVINLTDRRYKDNFDENTDLETSFEHLYWQAAGKDYHTGEKSYLLKEFENKYKDQFLKQISAFKTKNIWQKFTQLPIEDQQNPALIEAMRHYDKTVNITYILESGKGNGEATGGSDWQKYMHPKYQRRIFFPKLWTEEELSNWGTETTV
jgi:tryptophan 2,3-dioxygenase